MLDDVTKKSEGRMKAGGRSRGLVQRQQRYKSLKEIAVVGCVKSFFRQCPQTAEGIAR